MSRIDELKSLIRFYEEQLAEDEGDLYEEYEVELVAAIDELNKLTKKWYYLRVNFQRIITKTKNNHNVKIT